LYDAKLDGQPVLAITGHHYHDLIGTHAQQDVDLDKLFMDVAVYNTRIMGLAHVESVTHLACRTALSYRGVTHINFPTDIQDFTSAERSKRDVPGHTTAVRARGAGEPDERDLKYAADILNRGKKVAILAGRGALGAGQELEEAAEILGAPIVKALLGKVVPGFFLKPVSDAAVPDNSPYTTGGIGLLGTVPLKKRWNNAILSSSPGRLFLTSNLCRTQGKRKPCKSMSTRRGSGCAIRSMSDSSLTLASH